jgi:pimeloyl-ACP methyl ester carboxylesterase/DNA-binding winged helix-turn-helix (wHTH) protein
VRVTWCRAQGPESTTKLNRNYPEGVYRFGPFQLDLAGGQLLRDGQALKLRPKAFEMLQLLVENQGRLVSKDELHETVWQGRFVSDDSLVQALADIRRALGDEAGMIATVPKRGYRFDADVSGTPARGSGRPPGGPMPHTCYALSGELSIAYQVLGSGPIDLVSVPGWVTHLEYGWEEPSLARFQRRLADESRLILFDKRGTGLSDRDSGLPTLQQRMDDVRAVMDAVGSKRAVLFGMSEGCGMAMMFAATYPERTRGLILCGPFAKREWSEDYPWAPTPAKRQTFYNEIERHWGGPVGIEDIAPSRADDPGFRDWWASYQRRSASPAAALALAHMNTKIDTRSILPKIEAPTLVMHRTGDRDTLVEEGRYVAEHIPGARFVEFAGDDHLYFAGNQDEVLECAADFLAELAAQAEDDDGSGAFRSPHLPHAG